MPLRRRSPGALPHSAVAGRPPQAILQIPAGFLIASAVLFYFAFKIGFDKTNKYGVQQHKSAGRALLSHLSQGALALAAVILLLMAGCSVGMEPPAS